MCVMKLATSELSRKTWFAIITTPGKVPYNWEKTPSFQALPGKRRKELDHMSDVLIFLGVAWKPHSFYLICLKGLMEHQGPLRKKMTVWTSIFKTAPSPGPVQSELVRKPQISATTLKAGVGRVGPCVQCSDFLRAAQGLAFELEHWQNPAYSYILGSLRTKMVVCTNYDGWSNFQNH